ncbi:MAG: Rrf2 family transcriptional regulator [Bacteroidetes bacterium]|nr:Rrf2 family transcriptional regulator [Bacteroidota bacterium]
MLSKKAKYAIKTLEFIAEHHDEEPLRIAEIADKQGFPQKFLEAILLELRKDGILRSKLGKSGGYMLNREPKDIRLGHVIRLMDGPIALVPCVSYKYYARCEECVDEVTCGLRGFWRSKRPQTIYLTNVSLEDVLSRRKALLRRASKKKR